MPEQAAKPTNGHSVTVASPFGDSHIRAKKSQASLRMTLRQAVELKDLTFDAAMDLALAAGSNEESEKSRARAQALAGLVKAWDMACNRIRIQQGKPNPGSLRPESKPKKQKQASWAMVELVPKPKQLPPSTPPVVDTEQG